MNCFYCAGPASLLCDGKLPGGSTCDRPMCRSCVGKSSVFIACSRSPRRSVRGSVDYCPDCAARLVNNSASASDSVVINSASSLMLNAPNSASSHSLDQSVQNSASAHSQRRDNSASSRHVWMTTHTYTSHGIRYARFCWGKGSETWGYVHIAGGESTTELVQSRRKSVDDLIRAGATLIEILELLRSFENQPAGRKKKMP